MNILRSFAVLSVFSAAAIAAVAEPVVEVVVKRSGSAPETIYIPFSDASGKTGVEILGVRYEQIPDVIGLSFKTDWAIDGVKWKAKRAKVEGAEEAVQVEIVSAELLGYAIGEKAATPVVKAAVFQSTVSRAGAARTVVQMGPFTVQVVEAPVQKQK